MADSVTVTVTVSGTPAVDHPSGPPRHDVSVPSPAPRESTAPHGDLPFTGLPLIALLLTAAVLITVGARLARIRLGG